MKVKDVMHKGALSVTPSTPVREIAKWMKEEDIGAVPVKSNGQLVGMITDRDITCRAVGDSGDLTRLTAKDVMTPDVVSCSLDDDITIAVQLMEQKRIRRLPVTDSRNAVVGMLSLGDISHKIGKGLTGEVMRAVSGHHS